MIFKIFWILRGLIYKPFFGKFLLPSYIGKPIYIGNFKRIFIGTKVRIFPNARIEVVNNESSITLEDNISIGQNFHITSGEDLIIGKNTTITENVMVTNIDHEYQAVNEHILKQPLIIRKTQIGENCFIGYGVVIQAGTVLGRQCIVGSNAVVRGTFQDYSVIVGIPAKVVKRYDVNKEIWRNTNSNGEFIDNE